MDIHKKRERPKGNVKKGQEHRQPMDGRATVWELFMANRNKIEETVETVLRVREAIWDLRKTMGALAERVENLEVKKKEEDRGRGVSILGRTAPLTSGDYEAEAA